MLGGMTAPSLVILTGAGISRESGLATCRDADGIWAKVRLEDVATPEAFARDPARVHAFYNARRAQLRDPAIAPNAAHLALAELDARWPGGLLLVTQNVDDLHARAGEMVRAAGLGSGCSPPAAAAPFAGRTAGRMLHMHGELMKARCLVCEAVQPWEEDLSTATACPACGRTGGLRPHIVWFGEMPMHMEAIGEALERCDIFVSIGTSGQVYPAAGFVAEVAGRARTVELNLEPSAGSRLFDEAVHGPATEIVPRFVRRLLDTL
jgi:NAD-dependent deacetylase